MNQFLAYLEKTAPQIDSQIDLILTQFLQEVEDLSPKLLPLVKRFQTSCQGGKKVRGTLLKLGYEIGPPNLQPPSSKLQNILKVAAALEIFQSAILIHDDIADQSSLRRGIKTLYKSLGGDHYGISQAMAIGDMGFFVAIKTISESNFNSDKKVKAINLFTETVAKTCLGQMLDVELPFQKKGYPKDDVLTIAALKSAEYSLVAPFCLGAILAGADEKLLGKLGKFGENLGITFQIKDDILGVFGNEKDLGKSASSDTEEGKATLLISYAFEHATKKQKDFLSRFYGQGKIKNQQVLRDLRKIIVQTKAFDYARKKALEYVNLAKRMIPEIADDKTQQVLLTDLADFLIERSK